jgi:Protein of unknown function (DUF4239)
MMGDILLAILFICGFVLYGAIGTVVVRKFIHGQVAEGHNDVLVPLFLTAGVIYAVLLGFMVVGEWESYDAARANTGEEAAVLVPLYRQTTIMDASGRDAMRKVLREYAEHVVDGWQRFANGERNRRAGHDANALLSVIGQLKFENKAQELIAAQFLQTYSQLVLDRNKRYVQAADSLSWLMWFAAIGGGIVTVTMSFVLYMERRWPQVLAVCVMSALIGTLLFTMALLSRPFLGPLAIEPAPFEQSLSVFNDVDHGF